MIKEKRIWHPGDVRMFCIRNEYYCGGCNEEYDRMLTFVRDNEPTVENIYKVAADIAEHSDIEDAEEIRGIMFGLANDVMKIVYVEE